MFLQLPLWLLVHCRGTGKPRVFPQVQAQVQVQVSKSRLSQNLDPRRVTLGSRCVTHCHSIQQWRRWRAGPGTSPGPAKRYVLSTFEVQLTLLSQVKSSFPPISPHRRPQARIQRHLSRLINRPKHASNDARLVHSCPVSSCLLLSTSTSMHPMTLISLSHLLSKLSPLVDEHEMLVSSCPLSPHRLPPRACIQERSSSLFGNKDDPQRCGCVLMEKLVSLPRLLQWINYTYKSFLENPVQANYLPPYTLCFSSDWFPSMLSLRCTRSFMCCSEIL